MVAIEIHPSFSKDSLCFSVREPFALLPETSCGHSSLHTGEKEEFYAMFQ